MSLIIRCHTSCILISLQFNDAKSWFFMILNSNIASFSSWKISSKFEMNQNLSRFFIRSWIEWLSSIVCHHFQISKHRKKKKNVESFFLTISNWIRFELKCYRFVRNSCWKILHAIHEKRKFDVDELNFEIFMMKYILTVIIRYFSWLQTTNEDLFERKCESRFEKRFILSELSKILRRHCQWFDHNFENRKND